MVMIQLDQRIKQALQGWRERNYDGSSEVIPRTAKSILHLTNIQQLYEREPEVVVNPLDDVLGPKPKREEEAIYDSLRKKLSHYEDLMVLNDEAHHVHSNDLEWNKLKGKNLPLFIYKTRLSLEMPTGTYAVITYEPIETNTPSQIERYAKICEELMTSSKIDYTFKQPEDVNEEEV